MQFPGIEVVGNWLQAIDKIEPGNIVAEVLLNRPSEVAVQFAMPPMEVVALLPRLTLFAVVTLASYPIATELFPVTLASAPRAMD